jgi:hypothetical protein
MSRSQQCAGVRPELSTVEVQLVYLTLAANLRLTNLRLKVRENPRKTRLQLAHLTLRLLGQTTLKRVHKHWRTTHTPAGKRLHTRTLPQLRLPLEVSPLALNVTARPGHLPLGRVNRLVPLTGRQPTAAAEQRLLLRRQRGQSGGKLERKLLGYAVS